MLFFGSRSPRAPTKTDLVSQLRWWDSIMRQVCLEALEAPRALSA
jgi:hypothetical protein